MEIDTVFVSGVLDLGVDVVFDGVETKWAGCAFVLEE
jgi:hypothetical protein